MYFHITPHMYFPMISLIQLSACLFVNDGLLVYNDLVIFIPF